MNRRMMLVALAVVLALGGTLVVYSYARGADKRAVAGVRPANVLVVLKTVPAGTSWTDASKGDYFQQERLPASSVPVSAVQSLNASIPGQQVAGVEISAGQILLRPMFGDAAPAATGVLTGIPKGMVAVSVSMSSDGDVAGYVQPNSQIAVFGTFAMAAGQASGAASAIGGAAYTTKLIFPRVTVLATSQPPPGAKTTGGSGGLVTVALSQSDAQKLILSSKLGTLYFALLTDSSVVAAGPGVTNMGATSGVEPLFAG